ncbi:MAG: hypothetical protein V2I63_06120, partial [Pseudomonadales bacterium]|nr:hypothetical protein [Pseudomonadales bacterium]
MSRDEAGLHRHRIHSATTYQQLDVIHRGERWAFGGASIGLVVVLLLRVLASWCFMPDPFVSGCILVLAGLFGAWQGGMVGLTRENDKLAPCHHELE